MVHSGPLKSTRQQLVKVAQVPCLYRHVLNRGYYGIKKLGGKRKERSLKTTDRKLAERRLKVWLEGLSKVDSAMEHMTLRRLVAKLQKVNQGKAAKTQATDRSIIKKLKETWPADYDMKVMDIRPSHLNEWLSLHEKRLKHTSYNRYTGFLKQLFAIAVDDRIIVESPASKLKTGWKRPQKPVRHVPTTDQFKALVKSIREQAHSDTAEVAGDFVEFLGLAGVGQAEAASLIWAGSLYDSGKPEHAVNFRTKADWVTTDLVPGQYVCPSVFRTGSYSRSKANVAHRRYLVVESDTLSKDQICSIFKWLRDEAGVHLAAVISTGGKSLHGWFRIPDQGVLDRLQIILPAVGCDGSMFAPSQVCRLPSDPSFSIKLVAAVAVFWKVSRPPW